MAKKQNKSKDVHPHNKSGGLFSITSLFFIGFIAGAAYCGHYVYEYFTVSAEVPLLDRNAWWGPLPVTKEDTSIKPFQVEFSDVMIHDLRERLLHTKTLTPPLDNAGFTYGFNTNFLTQVLDYWKNKYDFKERENFMNKFEHFKTNVQGLDMHFMHVKPKVTGDVVVLPLLLIHGWPGSIREFYDIIPLLTTPRPGYKFVFEVIAPSLPGYGFSQAAVRPGLGAAQAAVILNNLMQKLGHRQYYIQGGDWGHGVGSNIATLYPNTVLGFHTNMPILSMGNPLNLLLTVLGSFWPSLVVEPELESRMYPLGEKLAYLMEEFGYMHLQATKPDTVGVALTDSPAGLAAYILEKFSTWTNINFRKASDGELLKKYTLTQLLDNIMVYWSTDSITTSMRLYAETMNKAHSALNLDNVKTPVPTWGLKCKYEISFTPDSFLRRKYTNYLQSTVVDDGGHFAAFENPKLLADDVFKAVETFREFHARKPDDDQVAKPEKELYETAETIYDFSAKRLNGEEVKLSKYKGFVTLIVNVASQCGLTDKNYKELNELYQKYENKGFRIVAFPCNQFNGQEPGSSKDISDFIQNWGVKFDVYEKVEVNGDNAHPLWKFLKHKLSGTISDSIKWNFSKFIIDRNGVPVERLGPNVNPLDLEMYLVKYW